MAIDATVNPLAYLEEAATDSPKETTAGGTFTPFFLTIADNQKALIRPLMNMIDGNEVGVVEVYKHEYWDIAQGKYTLRNMCAKVIGKECQICADVAKMPEGTKEEKDAKRKSSAVIDTKHLSRRFVLPVYLYAIVDIGTGKQVMYKNQAGEELPVSGPRLLEMKVNPTSQIFHDLWKAYQASESHDITKRDFKIERHGVKFDAKYDTTPMDISPFDPASHDIPVEWLVKEDVFALYQDACPPKIVGEEVTPAVAKANGAIKNVPDF